MTQVAISIQTLGNRKDTYLRREVGTMHKGTILAAVEEMLSDPDAYTIGKLKPTFKGRKPVKRGDEDERTREQLDELVATATG